MFGKQRKDRGLASSFGLALVAVLACCAFVASAAQAAPSWHIDGAAFTGEENVDLAGGPIAITYAPWGTTISCGSLLGSLKTEKGTGSSGSLTLSKCAVQEIPACTVEPLKLTVTGTLIGPATGQAYERYSITSGKWVIKGSECFLAGTHTASGTIADAIGNDAVKSARSFTPLAESVTGASGLQFAGHSWKVSGEATASLSGSHTGDEFGTGVGGTWTPEYGAVWMVGGKEFLGEATHSWGGETQPVQIKNAAGTVTIDCELSLNEGPMTIFGGDQSSGSLLLAGCGIASAPQCEAETLPLDLAGEVAVSALFVEKIAVDASWEMWGTGCPFTGTQDIDGSLGAWVIPEGGTSVYKIFEREAEEETKATGLHFANEYWHVTTEVQTKLSGVNSGKVFSVEVK